MYTYLHSLEPTSHHPIPSISVTTELRAELPVLCSRFPLVICFTHRNIHMSVLLSQYFSHPPFSRMSTCLFSTSVSIPALQTGSSVKPFWIPYMGIVVVQSLSCVWLFATSWTAACRTGFPVLHHLLEFAQAHVCWIGDAIQPSHSLSSPSPPAVSLFHQQDLFQWVDSLHQVATVLELQLQHQSFQWIFDWFPLGLTGWISL